MKYSRGSVVLKPVARKWTSVRGGDSISAFERLVQIPNHVFHRVDADREPYQSIVDTALLPLFGGQGAVRGPRGVGERGGRVAERRREPDEAETPDESFGGGLIRQLEGDHRASVLEKRPGQPVLRVRGQAGIPDGEDAR